MRCRVRYSQGLPSAMERVIVAISNNAYRYSVLYTWSTWLCRRRRGDTGQLRGVTSIGRDNGVPGYNS